MSLMQWNDSLTTGHARIDADHKRLVELVNRLYDAMVAGNGDQVCGRILAELFDYTKSHFAMEEQLMSAHGYAKAAQHRAQHAALVKEVGELKSRLDAGSHTLTMPLFKFLKEWLAKHIRGSDIELAKALLARSPAHSP